MNFFFNNFHNEKLWLLMLVANFSFIMFVYAKFGKVGLYVWVPISTILANIQVIILVELFGMSATLGNILYAGGFLVTDILSENYGDKEAREAVKLGFFSMVAMTVIMKVAISFAPSADGLKNLESVKFIFDFMPRLLVAGLIAYGISQTHDIWAYKFWYKMFPAVKHIWIRNNFSTVVSQIIDSFIFVTVAFYGVFPFDVLVKIFVSTYVIKFMVALLDTPFIYLASYLKRANKVREI
ncbi:MAG: queuosine precursor transporter [Fusobacteriaceae bacterium]